VRSEILTEQGRLDLVSTEPVRVPGSDEVHGVITDQRSETGETFTGTNVSERRLTLADHLDDLPPAIGCELAQLGLLGVKARLVSVG
tara:strand:- start:339 stop:599 length:261 start_codon:yes stop_codon:yes gene_type:complete